MAPVTRSSQKKGLIKTLRRKEAKSLGSTDDPKLAAIPFVKIKRLSEDTVRAFVYDRPTVPRHKIVQKMDSVESVENLRSIVDSLPDEDAFCSLKVCMSQELLRPDAESSVCSQSSEDDVFEPPAILEYFDFPSPSLAIRTNQEESPQLSDARKRQMSPFFPDSSEDPKLAAIPLVGIKRLSEETVRRWIDGNVPGHKNLAKSDSVESVENLMHRRDSLSDEDAFCSLKGSICEDLSSMEIESSVSSEDEICQPPAISNHFYLSGPSSSKSIRRKQEKAPQLSSAHSSRMVHTHLRNRAIAPSLAKSRELPKKKLDGTPDLFTRELDSFLEYAEEREKLKQKAANEM